MSIVVLVAAHKSYKISKQTIYRPILVGAKDNSIQAPIDETTYWVQDNSYCNISEKNPYYCELTALYWAWKNLKDDYIGLFHYRRYFRSRRVSLNKWERIMGEEELLSLLKERNTLLPMPQHYFIETNYSQYVHAHNGRELDIVREILSERYPAYITAFDTCMKQTSGHRFNMLVMRRDILCLYCEWLFDVLFDLENRLMMTGELRPRIIGHVAERLLDVWIIHNQISYFDVPVVFMERQHWIRKSLTFLLRKVRPGQEPRWMRDEVSDSSYSHV